jgi:hypothetical protein
MKKESEFPFDRAQRVTPEENQKFREAISEQFGMTLKNEVDPQKMKAINMN